MGIGHFLAVTVAALLVLTMGLFTLIVLARVDARRSRPLRPSRSHARPSARSSARPLTLS